jgi:hypothetical protein
LDCALNTLRRYRTRCSGETEFFKLFGIKSQLAPASTLKFHQRGFARMRRRQLTCAIVVDFGRIGTLPMQLAYNAEQMTKNEAGLIRQGV